MTRRSRIRAKRQRGYGNQHRSRQRGRGWLKKNWRKGKAALSKVGRFLTPVLKQAAVSGLRQVPDMLNNNIHLKTVAKDIGKRALTDTVNRARQQIGSGGRRRKGSRGGRSKGRAVVIGPGHWQIPATNRNRFVQPV